MTSPVEDLVLTTHLSRVQHMLAKIAALRPGEWFHAYSAGQLSNVTRLAAMAPFRELRLHALELHGLAAVTVRRVGALLFLPPGKALAAAYGETWRVLLKHVLETRKSIDAIRARMDGDCPNAQLWKDLAWQEDTICAFVSDVMATLEDFPPALLAVDARADLARAIAAHQQDWTTRRARRQPPGVPSRRRRRKRLPKFDPLPQAAPATPKTVDEQHADLELAAELFECEHCGGGMSQRIREGGANKLVCGYCKHERELAAPARRHVGVVDLDAAVSAARDELKELQGCRSFKCNECGAGVLTATEQMTVRCAYCGSEAFAQDDQFEDAFEPHGMPRFACDAGGAVKLLRNWLQARPDVDAAFEREMQVKAVEARYVPFWAFNIIADRSLVLAEGMAVCASRQVLHRLPAELRGVEPLETRNAPPFTREQMAAIATERFSIEPTDALRHALFTEREKLARAYAAARPGAAFRPESVTSANCRYMLLPLYFLLLRWREQEFHALVDGARAGVGLRYPKSVTRLIRKRWWVGAAAAGLLVVLAALAAVGAWGMAVGKAQREAWEAQEAELDRQAALRAEQRRIEMEELKHIVLPLDEQDVTWVSEPFEVTATTMTTQRFEITGRFPVLVRYHLRLSTEQRRSWKQARALREPAASAQANGLVRQGVASSARVGARDTVWMELKAHEALFQEIYRATMPEGTEPASPKGHIELAAKTGDWSFSGEFSLECRPYSSSRRKHLEVSVAFEADPQKVKSMVESMEWGYLPTTMTQAMAREAKLWTTTDPDAMATEIAKDVLAEWKRKDWSAQNSTAAVKSAAVRR
ncbi:MAG: hypothetical protein IPK87_12930 [Planctomycetes bacterium]|nr:hypothetical protein [Planctomycetota bacterium]